MKEVEEEEAKEGEQGEKGGRNEIASPASASACQLRQADISRTMSVSFFFSFFFPFFLFLKLNSFIPGRLFTWPSLLQAPTTPRNVNNEREKCTIHCRAQALHSALNTHSAPRTMPTFLTLGTGGEKEREEEEKKSHIKFSLPRKISW